MATPQVAFAPVRMGGRLQRPVLVTLFDEMGADISFGAEGVAGFRFIRLTKGDESLTRFLTAKNSSLKSVNLFK